MMPEKQPNLKNIVEAALFVASEPLSIKKLQMLFVDSEIAASEQEIAGVVKCLQVDYQLRGIQLKQVASGYRFQTCSSVTPWVSRLWQEKPPRYTRALLETLSLIAYRQPITRAEIEEVRGVAVSSNIIKTLLEREWIRVIGQRDVPGKPALYATTKAFLDYFNLTGLDELPSLMAIRDLELISAELGDPSIEKQPQLPDLIDIAESIDDDVNDEQPQVSPATVEKL